MAEPYSFLFSSHIFLKKYASIKLDAHQKNIAIKKAITESQINEKLKTGLHVNIKTKSTNISLAKNLQTDLSISNQLECEVVELNHGEILCSVKMKIQDTILESIITQNSALKIDIKVGDKIIALIKATDISIEYIR